VSKRSAAALIALASVVCGCRAHPRHPVVAALTSPAATRAVAERSPLMAAPDGAAARAELLRGFDDAKNVFQRLGARASTAGAAPRLYMLPNLERAAYQRQARGRSRTRPVKVVRNAAAVGYSAHFPAPPRAVADLILDPQAETRALGADRFALVGVDFDVPGATRRRFRVEMLRRGEGPFRFNLRFTFVTERWDLPDGSVVMRHDLCGDQPAEHVTVYQGASLIVPEGSGSRVTEFLVTGTDISVPFFLRSRLRKKSVELFGSRVRTLWQESTRLPR
jgi:hypothetical protein